MRLSNVTDIVTNADFDDNDLASFEDDEEPELILFPPIECPKAKIDCVSILLTISMKDLFIICLGGY